MPYNTSAILPRRDPMGSTQLPLARVKKIIALDQDIAMCSTNAAFVITCATELFVQYLAEQGHNVVKAERKPRRNIQYRDLANAVSRLDALEFLIDVVPRTETYKTAKARRRAMIGGGGGGGAPSGPGPALDGSIDHAFRPAVGRGADANGSTLLNGARDSGNGNRAGDADDETEDDARAAMAAEARAEAEAEARARAGGENENDNEGEGPDHHGVGYDHDYRGGDGGGGGGSAAEQRDGTAEGDEAGAQLRAEFRGSGRGHGHGHGEGEGDVEMQ